MIMCLIANKILKKNCFIFFFNMLNYFLFKKIIKKTIFFLSIFKFFINIFLFFKIDFPKEYFLNNFFGISNPAPQKLLKPPEIKPLAKKKFLVLILYFFLNFLSDLVKF
jgi:hypothetical protein